MLILRVFKWCHFVDSIWLGSLLFTHCKQVAGRALATITRHIRPNLGDRCLIGCRCGSVTHCSWAITAPLLPYLILRNLLVRLLQNLKWFLLQSDRAVLSGHNCIGHVTHCLVDSNECRWYWRLHGVGHRDAVQRGWTGEWVHRPWGCVRLSRGHRHPSSVNQSWWHFLFLRHQHSSLSTFTQEIHL